MGRVELAFGLLGKQFKLGYQPDISLFNILLNGFVHSNQLRKGFKLLERIVKLGWKPSLVTYGSVFKGLCSIGDQFSALRLLRNMESRVEVKPNVVIYSTIIDSRCKDKLLTQAIELFKEMESKGVIPDVVTYNTLI